MRTIYKYPLEVTDLQVFTMPTGGQILSVQVQNGIPCLWVLVKELHKREVRRIRIIGTGNPIGEDEHLTFIGTFQMEGGSLVFHVFEMI